MILLAITAFVCESDKIGKILLVADLAANGVGVVRGGVLSYYGLGLDLGAGSHLYNQVRQGKAATSEDISCFLTLFMPLSLL